MIREIPNKIVGTLIESIENYSLRNKKWPCIDSDIEEYRKKKACKMYDTKIQQLTTNTCGNGINMGFYHTPVPTMPNQVTYTVGSLVKIDQHEFSEFLIQYICRGYLEDQICEQFIFYSKHRIWICHLVVI